MTKRTILRRVVSSAAFLLTAVLLLTLAGRLLRPPQVSYGSTWKAYLAEPEDSVDVLFFGSSFAYCDFSPAALEEQSGLSGYVMGGSEQTMSLTYWYLREALRTQSPAAVVIEPTGVFFEKYQNYTQSNIVYMPPSLNKLGAIFTAAQPELRAGLLCDLWFYHNRWQSVTRSDLKYALTPARPDERRGFTGVEGTVAQPVLTQYPRPLSAEQYEENFSWLVRSLELCRQRDIPVLVLVNPTYSQCSPEQYLRLESDIAAAAPEAVFVNWSSEFASLGLEPALHLYDNGHLNRDGAQIYAKAVGQLLQERLELKPVR